MLEGRRADPRRADELLINAPMAHVAHLRVGDRTTLSGPFGIDQPVRVVGIYVSPLDLGPNGNQPGSAHPPSWHGGGRS